jgi:FkbM family methyltransferase
MSGRHPGRMLRSWLWQLPWTRFKLLAARALYYPAVLAFGRRRGTVVRNGIQYDLDLGEGIDLSVFLFGSFQPEVVRNRFVRLPADGVVVDVGANVGILSLQIAQAVPAGRVFAFEPTHYAFARLKRNLELNPGLAARVEAVQAFVSSASDVRPGLSAYASWRVDGTSSGTHPLHGGTAKSADEIGAVSLDDFVAQRGLPRVDFIKIDTDGHELEVLRGARRLLARHRPVVVFEIARYVMDERGIDFSDYVSLLAPLGYALFDAKSGAAIDLTNHTERIPVRASIDIAAVADPAALP